MATRYGRSPWVDRFPKSRTPSFPRQRGSQAVDVVIVGGGLTGCAVAYAFAAAGVGAVLVEAEQVGRGRSGSASGWVAPEPGLQFSAIQTSLGMRAARHAFQAWRRASLDLTALVRRLAIKCDVQPCRASIVGRGPDQVLGLRREHKARREAGLEASWLTPRVLADETGLGASGGIGLRDGATVDPYRAALGLAAAAAERGVGIFERSPVKKITFTRRSVDVLTVEGRIRASKVVIATGAPTPLFRSLSRHFRFRTSYSVLSDAVPARLRHGLGKRLAVVRDQESPPHVVRWVDDERLLVSGADGPDEPARQRPKRIVQRTGQLMYELSTMYPEMSGIMPAYGWHIPYAQTGDGLPYIGPHRNYPHHLFAFGDSSRGVTGSYLASRILLRHHLNKADSADDVFGFHR